MLPEDRRRSPSTSRICGSADRISFAIYSQDGFSHQSPRGGGPRFMNQRFAQLPNSQAGASIGDLRRQYLDGKLRLQ